MMKRLVVLCMFVSSLRAHAQEKATYPELLNEADELAVPDSLLIQVNAIPQKLMDTATVKKWFPNLLPTSSNNRLKNRNYYLSGKITGNSNFDLLLVMEEKKKNDSAGAQVIYLVTRKKDGSFIASLEAAVAGNRKNSSYNTFSWLYNSYTVVLNSKMVINEKSYDDRQTYRINKSGRFILAPKY